MPEITPHPDSARILQVGRNLTDVFRGFLPGIQFLLLDRDGSFHCAFRTLLANAGIRCVRTPPQSPNCNAHIDRFHRSFKREVADRMIFLGEEHLRSTIDEYLAYYHRERNHQGLAGRIIEPSAEVGSLEGQVRHRERLGGLLNYYYRDAT